MFRHILIITIIVIAPLLSFSQKRVALVIGAQNYTSLPPLHHPLNDATSMTAALKEKGFDVEALYDPKSRRDIREAITRYFNKMNSTSGATGIIFYAGHGIQYEGENYIIPINATLDDPGSLEENCIKMNTIMEVLRSTNNSLNILLLDACRSLPSFTRGNEAGLTRVEAPQGSIVVFATQPGKVASDGTGKNGLFTSKLLDAINDPNLNITDVFKKVKQDVFAASNKGQLPSVEDNSIGGDFYFTAAATHVKPKPFVPVEEPKTQETKRSTQTEKKPAGNGKPELTEAQKKEAMRNEKRMREKGLVEDKDKSVIAPAATTIVTVPKVNFGYGPTTKAVLIGKQIWSTVNLSVTHFANGAPITRVEDGFKFHNASKSLQPAWSHPDLDSTKKIEYGMLYNWYAVADPRGLCPTGWHVPTDEEFRELTSLFGGNLAGKVLKADDTWADNINGAPGYGDDVVGFRALPTGKRILLGTYQPMSDSQGWWWSSSINTESVMPVRMAWTLSMQSFSSDAYHMEMSPDYGAAVRCLKD